MARNRSPGYDDQREAILAQAAGLFAQKGYPATSMNEIAQACGLSKPGLYHYFRDKYAILVDIAEEHVDRLHALVVEVEAGHELPQERLRVLIERFVRIYANASNAHRVLTDDVRFLNDADRARVLEREREIVAGFARAIGGARPALAEVELDKPLTMLLFGMINWMFTWVRPDGRYAHDEIAPIVADLFFGGLQAVRVATEAAET